MGLISKIEDKLSGGDKHASSSSESNRLQKERMSGGGTDTTSGSSGMGEKLQDYGEREAAQRQLGSTSGSRPSGMMQSSSGSGGNSGMTDKAESYAEREAMKRQMGDSSSGGVMSGGGGHSSGGGMTDRLSDIRNPIGSHQSKSHSATTGSSGMPSTGAMETGTAGAGTLGSGGTATTMSGRGGDPVDRERYGGGNYSTRVPGAYDSTDTQQRSSEMPGSRSNAYPTEPYDPYSSSGQRNAAAAGEGGGYNSSSAGPGYSDSNESYGRRSVEDPDVARTRHGGVTNQMEPTNFNTGPHSQLENRNAIPIAGGERVGSGSGMDSGIGSGSTLNRGAGTGAAGMAGMAGMAGTAGRDRDTQGYERDGLADTREQTYPQSYQQTGTENTHPSLRHHRDDISYMNRPPAGSTMDNEARYGDSTDRSGLGMGSSALGSGASTQGGSSMGYQPQRTQASYVPDQTYAEPNTTSSPTHDRADSGSGNGLSTGRKLGGAYEAGYNDALAHMEAERQK